MQAVYINQTEGNQQMEATPNISAIVLYEGNDYKHSTRHFCSFQIPTGSVKIRRGVEAFERLSSVGVDAQSIVSLPIGD